MGKQDIMSKPSNAPCNGFMESRVAFNEGKQTNLSELWFLHTNVFKFSCKFGIDFADKCIYLLLTEFEVRAVSYGPSFFPFELWPKRINHRGKNEDP